MNQKDYLEQIDKVIQDGEFKDNWKSLSKYQEPTWYKDAKFGIFTHWGVYSVPAFASEWYPRAMYTKGHKVYEHHIKTYGEHKNFSYADFIPMFKAEKFDPKEWLDLIEESGAKYYMPVAEHHDGFQMYDSELSDWNASKMGPKKDVIAMLKEETEKRDIRFCVSNHRAENYWFMCGGRDFDSGIQDIHFQEPYGFAKKIFEFEDENKNTHNIHATGASREHLEDWLARACELVDKFEPSIVWFDWWIQNVSFKPYLKKFAAYYYNRAKQWGKEVAINYKEDAYALGTAIFDVERGQLSQIRPNFWQTDTSVAKNSWSYTEGNNYKTPESLVCDLIDIVSKNGALLLNIGPKADGTIPEEDASILKAIGKWLKVNGEAIYETRYWSTYGEGPTQVIEGPFNDTKRVDFTSQDIRYTYKAPFLYAHVMKCPENSKLELKSLVDDKIFRGDICDMQLLGYENQVVFDKKEDAVHVEIKGDKIDTSYPVVIKITID